MNNSKLKLALLVVALMCMSMSLFAMTACTVTGGDNSVNTELVGGVDFIGNALINEAVLADGGINADEKVNVFIRLEGDALYEGIALHGAEYAGSEEGRLMTQALAAAREDVAARISASGIEVEYKHTYNVFFNGFSANVRYGDVALIEAVDSVQEVVLSEAYTAPTATQTEQSYEMLASVLNEGVYDGEGTSIAIIDTGVSYNHEVFADEILYGAYTREQIEYIIDTNYLAGRWVSSKIPYAYDYADGDRDVLPDNFHGTHVAGIAAGRSNNMTGVAPLAQILAMKVFADGTGAGYQTDIVRAVEDAVILGVDVMNLSLGMPAGFTREYTEEGVLIWDIYEKVETMGITLCISAGNEYNSAFNSMTGTSLAANPDYGLVGSPASYPAAFAIASTDTYKTQFYLAGDFSFTLTNTLDANASAYDFIANFVQLYGYGEYEYVTIGGLGEDADYEGIDVEGKIAFVMRGVTSFEDKARIAYEHGAIACIVINNVAERINAQILNFYIPTALMDYSTGVEILKNATGTISILEENAIEILSEFSSWGPLADLTLKPDVAADGGKVRSSYGTGAAYQTLSGTSMSAPYVSGLAAVAREYVRDLYGDTLTADEEQAMVYQLMMSTAVPFKNINGVYASPRKQGAGRVNLENLLNTKAYLTVAGSDRAKLELGDDPDRTGIYNLQFNIVNISDEALVYNVNAFASTDYVNADGTLGGAGYRFTALSEADVAVYFNNALTDGEITVEAGETAVIKVVITLSENEKAYLDENYVNGAFVEGYAVLTSESEVELSIPFLSFYGDYARIPAFDADSFSPEGVQMFETKLVGHWNNNSYLVHMGLYAYQVPEGMETPKTNSDYISLSIFSAAMNGLYQVQLGVMKNLSKIEYYVTDYYTGEELWFGEAGNVNKTYYNTSSGQILFYTLNISLDPYTLNLSNNQEILLTIRGYSEYDKEVYDEISYPITIDFEYARFMGYDGYVNEEGRKILVLEVFDNQYLQDLQLFTYNSSGSYVSLSNYAVPVYNFEKGRSNTIELDVTDYLGKLYNDTMGIKFEDYAFNYAIYDVNNVSNLFNPLRDYNIVDGVLTGYNGSDVDVVIPEVVTAIGDNAFARKTTLKSITFEGKITSIGKSAFAGCTALERVTFAEGTVLEKIDENAFDSCKSLKEITIPEISAVGIKSFYNSGLETLTMTGTTVPILKNSNAFKNDAGECILSKIIVPDKLLESYKSAKYWKEFADIMNSDRAEGNAAPDVAVNEGKEEQSDFIIDENGVATRYIGKGGDVVIPDGVTKLADSLFYQNQTITSVYIPDSVKELGIVVFFCCFNLESVRLSENLTVIPTSTFYGCTALKSIVIPESVTKIGDSCFSVCISLEEIDLSNCTQLKEIAQMAFNQCTMLKRFELPVSVETVGRQLFYACIFLEEVIIPEGSRLTAFGENMFNSCTKLKTLDLRNARVNSIPGGFLVNCYNLETVYFPDTIETIAYGPFNASGIRVLDLSNTKITEIGYYMAYQLKSLEKIILPEGITTIREYAFAEAVSLKELVIPETVTTIERYAFYKIPSLALTMLGDTPPSLGQYAFRNVSNLCIFVSPEALATYQSTSGWSTYSFYMYTANGCIIDENGVLTSYQGTGQYVTLGAEVKAIGANAFAGNEKIREVYIYGSLEYIGEKAFENSSIRKFTVTGDVGRIDSNAFAGCTLLTLVKIDTYVVPEIGSDVFSGNENLVIEVIDGMEAVLEEKWSAYAGYIVENGYTIQSGLLKSYKGIKEHIVIPAGVTIIDTNAFIGNTTIRSVVIPEGVTSIRNSAFRSCVNLERITLPESLLEIQTDALSFTGLRELVIPAGVTTMQTMFIRNCTEMLRLDFHCVINLTTSAIMFAYSMENLEEINFYGKVECINSSSFFGNPSLKRIIFHADVNVIGAEGSGEVVAPFAKNPQLEEVIFMGNVVSIGNQAFNFNYNLTKVEFHGNLVTLGLGAFNNCIALEGLTASKDNKHLANDTYGLLYDHSMTRLFRAMHGWSFDGTYVMPDTVVTMDEYCFSYGGYTMVDMINVIAMVYIGYDYYQFDGFKFTGIELSDSLRSVSRYAFYGNENLKTVKFGNEGNLRMIATYAFAETGVISIDIPAGVETLAEYCFSSCKDLEHVSVPAGVKAFDYNKVFLGCTNISDFVIDEDNSSFLNVDGVLYNKEMTILYFYPTDKTDETFTVPEGVIKISSNAFLNNKYLKTIYLPESLRVIGDRAFFGTDSLVEYHFKSRIAPVLEGAYDANYVDYYFNFFANIREIGRRTMTLYCPEGSNYEGRVWESFFANIIVETQEEENDINSVNEVCDAFNVCLTEEDTTVYVNESVNEPASVEKAEITASVGSGYEAVTVFSAVMLFICAMEIIRKRGYTL